MHMCIYIYMHTQEKFIEGSKTQLPKRSAPSNRIRIIPHEACDKVVNDF